MQISLVSRLLVAITFLLAGFSLALAAPKIDWTPDQVNHTMAVGQTTSDQVTVSFTSSEQIDRITFEVNKPLSDVVTIEPAAIDNVQAGVTYNVVLRFALPAGAGAGTQHGVLHVRAGKRALPEPLKILLNVDPAGPQILLGTNLPITDTFAEIAVLFSQTLAQKFTLTSPVSIETIKLQLSGFGSDQLTMRLTNSLGPGTTQSNVLLQRTLTFPNTGGAIRGSTVSVPVDLDLAPGDYFIVLDSPQGSPLQGWLIATAILPSTVGSVGDLRFSTAFLPPFPPDTNFFPVGIGPAAFQLIAQ